MPEVNYVSTDVALCALHGRIDLVKPVIDALSEGEPLRHLLRVHVAHYSTAIKHLEAGHSVQHVASSIGVAAARALGSSSQDFVALTDLVALFSGQRVPERANLDV